VAKARLTFMELLKNTQEVDRHMVAYPWSDADWHSREPATDNPEAIPTLLSNMKKYTYQMPINSRGASIPPSVLQIHGSSRQDNGKYWKVATINRARHVKSPTTASRRNNQTRMAAFLSR